MLNAREPTPLFNFPYRLLFFATVLLLTATYTHVSRAADVQGEEHNLVNWYYANLFGTGAYKVGDTTVEIFGIPVSYTLQKAQNKQWGKKILLPVTVGFYDFHFSKLRDVLDINLDQDVATLSFVPGFELEIPLRRNWSAKPYVYLGYGKELTGGISAWLYGAGIRSKYSINWGKSSIAFGGAFDYAEYSASDGQTRSTSIFSAGVNLVFPLNRMIYEYEANAGIHFITYFYFNELDFVRPDNYDFQFRNEYEVALTVGTYTPMKVYGVSFDRIGLAYRFGKHLKAIRLVGSFPF